ncbi:hypothetical protein GEV33_014442 [Tenebrio molitor]|uniref:ABC transporter domain-containing protein n=1 Tax=Tenebrio molitor TaxID=7067 RepID=A0A8J6H4Z6_TENMO|nr:hypothetical protein GEV33_014442 [Tenebrio molitor]
MFSEFFVCQYFFTIGGTCIPLFVIFDDSSSVTQITESIFYVLLVNALVTIAFIPAGEIEIEADNLSLAIYSIDWYNTKNLKICKFVLFWLAQSQTPVQMSGAGIVKVNRYVLLQQTFANVLHGTARIGALDLYPPLRFYASGAFSIDSPTPTLRVNLNERTRPNSKWKYNLERRKSPEERSDLPRDAEIPATPRTRVIVLEISAAHVGLVLSQAAVFKKYIGFAFRRGAGIETELTSVGRILEYTEHAQEHRDGVLVEGWPQRGEIRFTNVYLSYDCDNYVLHNLNCTVEPQETIAIVGRTAAGKSSIISTILRLHKFEGKIFIDEVDIATLPLETLRSNISVISQDPALFTGTIRENIDLTGKYTDAEIWDALKAVNLSILFSTLDYMISTVDSNLSLGQKQLLCLARAIIRKSKIVIMDEVTASVDKKIEKMIHKIVLEEFACCTVIMITHKLDYVLEYDKVIVLDKGGIVEFDTPSRLLENPFIPCRLPPPPLVVAGGTDTGTILAFVGGWFKFKLGYLMINILLRHTIPGNLNFTPKALRGCTMSIPSRFEQSLLRLPQPTVYRQNLRSLEPRRRFHVSIPEPHRAGLSGKVGRLQEPCEFPESANILSSTSVYINEVFSKPTISICNQEDKENAGSKESRLKEPCEFPESVNILSSTSVYIKEELFSKPTTSKCVPNQEDKENAGVILYGLETIFYIETVFVIVVFDGFYLLMCCNLKIQFALLCEAVRLIQLGTNTTRAREEICWKKLKQYSQYHKFLLTIHKKLNKVFSEFFVCQYFLTIGGTCIPLFVIFDTSSSVTQVTESIIFAVLANVVVTLTFISAGEIEIEADNLTSEIYNIDWYNTKNLKICKFVLFWLARSQTPVQMSGLNKFSARWIPKLLNSEQKLCWQHICEENLEALCLKEFFSKIVTGDETWMYFWDTPTKHEFMQWVHKGSPPPTSKNAEFMRKSNGDGSTITGEVYKKTIRKLLTAIQQKGLHNCNHKIMLFHGNYRVYKARQVREAIDECGFVEMEHPPYTPDLAPSPKEELLGLLPLKGRTRGEDTANAVIECIEKHHIPLDKIVSISTDGAKSMTGVRNGFVAILKEKINHEILTYHCIIHQEALCAQTFPEKICKVMELVIKIINSIIAKALNHRQFKEFLVEVESEYADLLLHNKGVKVKSTEFEEKWAGGRSSESLYRR